MFNRLLIQLNPIGESLGEIGLDRTEPDYMWREQDYLFRRMLTLSRPDKVLVLHLRGSSDLHSSDVLMSALHLVRKACGQVRNSIFTVSQAAKKMLRIGYKSFQTATLVSLEGSRHFRV